MNEKYATLSSKLLLILKGLLMGGANKVPGVSGGTVAFVAGFYEDFIYSLQKFNKTALKLFINLRFKSLYRYVNGGFLLLIVTGMLISYFSVSKILDYLLHAHELYVWATFFGMILGSIYYINQSFKDWNKFTISALLLGVTVGLALSFLPPAQENDNLIFVFLCGIIGVLGMTLPGVSGSFILILLGNYVLLLVDSVNALFDTLKYIFQGEFALAFADAGRVHLLQVLAVFALGSVAGMISLSHVFAYILKRWHQITIAGIIGFITGSLLMVWPWKKPIYKTVGAHLLDAKGNPIVINYTRYFPDFSNGENSIAILFIVLGISVLLFLSYYEKNKH